MSLSTIVDDVSEVHHRIASTAEQNQAQASVITQIRSAVSGMDRNTKNAAMVEESSAAARLLMEQGQTLAEDAGRFRLPEPIPSNVSPAHGGQKEVVLH